MKACFTANKPDEIEYSLTITATAREFLALRDQLANAHPSWVFASMITDLLRHSQTKWREPQESSR